MDLVKPTTASSCYEYNKYYYLKRKEKTEPKAINEKNCLKGVEHPLYKSDRTSYAQKCYDKNKEKYLKTYAERVNCPYCSKDLRRGSLSRHKKLCKSKPED